MAARRKIALWVSPSLVGCAMFSRTRPLQIAAKPVRELQIENRQARRMQYPGGVTLKEENGRENCKKSPV